MASDLIPALRRWVRGLHRYTSFFALLVLATIAMWAGFLLGVRDPSLPPSPDRLQVAVLNTGQGEAAWIGTPDGHFIVIGAGPGGQGSNVAEALKDAGARRIDLLIIPYPYAEAAGGAADLIGAIPIARAMEPGGPEVNSQQAQMRAALKARHVPVLIGRAGNTIKLHGVTVEILAPSEPLLSSQHAAANNSLVVRVKWGSTAFLWAGGIEQPGENALLAREPDLSAGWLRVARCAGPGTSSPEFLRLVGAETAVVSSGPNSSGCPDQAVLDRITATGASVYRTDSQPGPLTFYSDGNRITGPY